MSEDYLVIGWSIYIALGIISFILWCISSKMERLLKLLERYLEGSGDDG